jgi:TPP-dependent pyruvate/acetoin dehydrogenase alpha subunit
MTLALDRGNQLGDLADPTALHAALDIDGMDPDLLKAQLSSMLLIRRSEEAVGTGVERKQVRGPAHLGIGQEAIAVGVSRHLQPSDRVFGTHRSHSHYLALGGDLYSLFAEILGRDDGCSRGMGGSMHLYAGDRGLLGTVPIVAGTISVAVGAALAARKDGRGDVAVAYFGDGACEEGAFHESLNLASTWELPVLFVCENNLFSSHMHISLRQPANRVARFAEANCIPAVTLDGNDVVAVSKAASQMVQRARANEGPSFLEAVTYRWRGHVGPREDEDVGVKRGTDLVDWKERDPIRRLSEALMEAGELTEGAFEEMQGTVLHKVEAAWSRALKAEYPPASALLDRVYEGGNR